jgi:hypothetical protein
MNERLSPLDRPHPWSLPPSANGLPAPAQPPQAPSSPRADVPPKVLYAHLVLGPLPNAVPLRP